ncbi:hypothetical protein Cadr_000024730 [Camelus dromedarius]|uniref:Uncharacterized protein n=1 Tax=Camelus dromedarius TaxID=9838 RepID=A0A5N4CQ53_CAMDR|nr:hypothetical protein Cadr_000024730 [Camelus dromedarius]
MGMGVLGREGEHQAPEPAPLKEGEGPPGQGGEIVQGRAQAKRASGERVPFPQLRSPLSLRLSKKLFAHSLGKGAPLTSWGGGVAARGARPRGARPPDGAGSPVLRKAPPNPSPGPTPCTAPARGRRESGAAAVAAAPARTWAGRRTPPGPPCPLAPGRERREQDIPCPGTREGRAGEENQRAAPLAGRGPSRCPQGRASQSGHPAPSPGPHDSALGAGRRGTRMAPSLQAQSPSLSSFYLAFPHLPFLCRPLCIIHCQEKGTETRKEGPSPPYTAKTPRGMGAGQGFGPKPPTP